ncbi:dnaJ homolog subfamily C member 24 [Orussus abietinus]|uniref:dnaJ homolog subfamily C member 24 n=1 Tax=Orussus abietinus TaxID=222816 RepID=UPI000625BF88|nr:dnaJ homolog subfamily C member 24 [Orussus abietinus]
MQSPRIDAFDYYEVLGCTKDSTYEDIKRAYYQRALQCHPDKKGNSDCNTNEFRRIEEAWRILRDHRSREDYNTQCRQAELESQSLLIYATVTLNELEPTMDKDILSYQCRCGSDYIVNQVDLQEQNCTLQIPCQECTFVILVET